MQQINEKSHYSTLINSLNKEYKKTKIGKPLTPNDIYLLDIVYNLLQGCCLELCDIENKKLLNIYNNILFTSKTICDNSYPQKYQISKKDKFIQAEKTDCNNNPLPLDLIYYWQESLGVNSDDIINLIETNIYLDTKPSDLKSSFIENKSINYINIGLICFALNKTSITDIYKIYDDDNNADITSAFESFYNEELRTRIFISFNTYSYGLMNFKIKKI